VVPAGDAEAYQVRAHAGDVRALAINTTDGPRSLVWGEEEAGATHLPQPPVISRPTWGADESYRFNKDGSLRSTPTFFPTQKLIVHHTVTSNADPDPAATVRAIYYDHVKNRGFADIAYNFLIDAQGNIYKGRYSGRRGTSDADTLTGENAKGKGVTGAHTGGYNSGTMGVALLGTFTSVPPTAEARSALIDHLAWEADHHGLDPLAASEYVNPQSGDTREASNISGHRDWGSTACPGGALYADLPAIRQEVAARVGAVDSRPPRIKRVDEEKIGKRVAVLTWETNEPADSQVRYKRRGKRWKKLERPRRSDDHRLRVGRLKPDRRYSYRVGSADLNDNLAWSRRFRFETAA
ncbi:MAG: N-acetylmuramoyl-L-alanine amidase, partial [Actinomycetota bacterium]